MGNSLQLPCPPCQEATAVAAAAGVVEKRRRKKQAPAGGGRSDKAKAKASRYVVVPVLDTPEREMKSAWPGCRVETGGDGMRVTVVMKRKDAAELMARLEVRCALERKARMVELNAGLTGGSNGGVMRPCRDGWAPRLASISEIN
ncbi:uncharacterized protein LOC107304204 [Oryza brachyantha]|uniref:uncharacterized protein LOC107304204 n=1 Tax=Oryza brachyantha TaxID=4533 RepID=UPI001ADC9415|nr:uncharacterized protein LOC107304204 [Oryza brachyantha]